MKDEYQRPGMKEGLTILRFDAFDAAFFIL